MVGWGDVGRGSLRTRPARGSGLGMRSRRGTERSESERPGSGQDATSGPVTGRTEARPTVDEIGDGFDSSERCRGRVVHTRRSPRGRRSHRGPADGGLEHFEGPLLVVAGPGSGKTRVITRRIARLIDRGVRPRNILAITFTNKAAREMEERVGRLVPGAPVWVSTFHRLCARLLRQYGSAVGLAPNFTILDTTDQRTLVKQVLHDLDIDGSHYPPRGSATASAPRRTSCKPPR